MDRTRIGDIGYFVAGITLAPFVLLGAIIVTLIETVSGRNYINDGEKGDML